MSYILDALKKSDQQRQRDAAPAARLASVPASAPTRPRYGVLVIAALLLLALGFVIGGWQPWQDPPAPVTTPMPQPAPAPDATPAEPAPATVMPAAPLPETAPPSVAAPEGTTRDESALPGDVRAALPNLVIALHSHSSVATERLVMINGKLLREGDSFGPGLRVEEITADGIILGFKGYRFLHTLH